MCWFYYLCISYKNSSYFFTTSNILFMLNNNTTNIDAYEFGHENIKTRKMILPRTNKAGQTKIYIEILFYSYEGKGKYTSKFKRIPTKIWIKPQNWNQSKEVITRGEKDFEYKNNIIDKTYFAVSNYVNSKGMQEPNAVYIEKASIAALTAMFPSRQENRKTLVDYIDDYIEYRKQTNTPRSTYKEFITMKNRVAAFDEYNKKKSYIDKLNLTWSDDFAFFLRKQAKNRKEIGYGEGTIEKTYTILITVLNHFFERKDELQIDVSDKYKLRNFKKGIKSKNDANPLTSEQLETLYKHSFDEEHLELTKERFCLQCYTGLRFSDVFLIKPKNIIDNTRIVIIPQKTKSNQKRADVPLNKYSRAILAKYDYDTSKLKIANQPYNRNLKQMFVILRETYPELKYHEYSTHNARDTFISMAVEAGVDWKSILGWVCQSSYSIMDRYIKITEEFQQNQMNKVFN